MWGEFSVGITVKVYVTLVSLHRVMVCGEVESSGNTAGKYLCVFMSLATLI